MQAKVARRRKICIHTPVTRYVKGGRTAISMRFHPDLLKALDELAERLGNTNRSELIELGAKTVLESHGYKVNADGTVIRPKR